MNKIRVRVMMTPDKQIHIQVSTDNQVWFTIKVGPEDMKNDLIAEADALFKLTSNSHAIATHIFWKA